MRARRSYPFPEVLSPGPAPFTLRDTPGRGQSCRSQRRLEAPMGPGAVDLMIRLHEMAHVRWSPAGTAGAIAAKRGLPLDLLQVCEDARMHTLLTREGFAKPLNAEAALDPADVAYCAKERRRLLCATLGSYGTADYLPLREALLETARDLWPIVRRALAMIQGKPTFRTTLAATKYLASVLDHDAVPPPDPPPGDGPLGDALREAMANMHRRARPRPGPSSIPWGEMTLETPPRPLRLPPNLAARASRATDCGANPARLARYCTDGRIFVRKVRALGASLLIDGSGSMRLSAGEILACLTAAPAATIAVYGSKDGDAGTLHILAASGTRVAPLNCRSPGNGNVIDGPALRWLATQPGPRLWVSDGVVTGVGDRASAALARECYLLCLAHSITLVPNLATALACLTYRARTLSAPGVRASSSTLLSGAA